MKIMPRSLAFTAVLFMLFICLIPSSASTPQEAYELYDKTSFVWEDPEVEDGIDLCYRSISLAQMDLALADPQTQELALGYFLEILERQLPSGEIMRYRDGGTVNPKLMTGLGAWAMAVAYSYTGDEMYSDSARAAANFLMGEMDEWESTYPAECDDPRCELARNGGINDSSLTSYCWTSPNDLGLVALGIGAVVYYGAGDTAHYDYCIKLADALYDMQLSDGSWYDGYAYKLPTRWDRSTHYITMAMMGTWMAYKISGDEKYSSSLNESWAWLSEMQNGSGSVYDIWVDDNNMYKASQGTDNRFDFLQVGGDTNEKEYYDYPFKTFLGEFSFMLSGAFMNNVGLDPYGYSETKGYVQDRMAISNWYMLSLTLEMEEPLIPFWNGAEYGEENGACSLGGIQKGEVDMGMDRSYIILALLALLAILVILWRGRNENG